jgi:hypothetical protein
LKQVFGATFLDEATKYVFVKGLRNGLTLFFRIRNAVQRGKKFLFCIDII